MRNREFLLNEIAPKDKEVEHCLLCIPGNGTSILIVGDRAITDPEIIKKRMSKMRIGETCVCDTGLDSDLDQLNEEEKERFFTQLKKAIEIEKMIKQAKQ
jgi:hypothetical protein